MASLARLVKRRTVLTFDPSKRCPFIPFCTSQQTISPPPPPPPVPPPFQAHEKETRRWSSLFLFLPGTITFGLGTWQIFRRQEKIEMLDYRRKRLELEPMTWKSISSELLGSGDGDLSSLEFRRVAFEGIFDNSKSIYVGPRSRSISGVTENGYYVVTPLTPAKNNSNSLHLPILVNRGWVPRSWRNKSPEDPQDDKKPTNITSAKEVEQKNGHSWWKFWSTQPKAIKDEEHNTTVEVIGVVRGSEKPCMFVPANDPNSGQWFYVDVPALAHACGLPEDIMYVEDTNENTSASNRYPVPKDVNSLIRHSVMPQDHLNYTLTWYSLSAAVTFMAFKRLAPKKILR